MKRTATEHYLLNCSGCTLDLRRKPAVMGILNLTPDSFSDGGAFQRPEGTPEIERAVAYALSMVRNGAAIIDIGGESTRPGAEKVSAEEEIRRTVPVILELRNKTDALISIDTYKAEVAEAALRAGAQIVNDISGFSFDGNLAAVCRKYGAAAVLMHTPSAPQSMKWSTEIPGSKRNVTARVSAFLQQAVSRAQNAGVDDIIIDPGFGFGKSVDENFTLLGNLAELLKLRRPVLAGVSRKSFLGSAVKEEGKPEPPPAERSEGTTAAQTIALMNGAAIIRAHDVRAAAHAASIVSAVQNAMT
ncbi:MAG: dihydropteroate synthase [Chlorobi bacterium]|nr:dihydropteroate synthase [Chlorobiota bacterium]